MQPLATIAASRYALGADGMGALRARAPAAARSHPVAASRCALGAEGVGAARSGAYMFPPITCARCLLVVGMSKTSCAARCSRRLVQRGLRVLPAEGERVGRGGPDIMMRKCVRGTLACCRRMCSASRCDAPLGK